jgi:hypothetical protein
MHGSTSAGGSAKARHDSPTLAGQGEKAMHLVLRLAAERCHGSLV